MGYASLHCLDFDFTFLNFVIVLAGAKAARRRVLEHRIVELGKEIFETYSCPLTKVCHMHIDQTTWHCTCSAISYRPSNYQLCLVASFLRNPGSNCFAIWPKVDVM